MRYNLGWKKCILALLGCVILILNSTIRYYILKYFGYSIFLIPIWFLLPSISVFLYSILFLSDNFGKKLFPYKFCGILGEYMILINKKLYYLPVILGIIVILFLIFQNYRKIENVFDVLDKPISYEKMENHSNLLIKLLQKYSIQTEVKKIEIGAFYTRYYVSIPHDVKFGRFSSLSPDLSSFLKLKVRTVCDLQYSYVEIENSKKQRIFFKEFLYAVQPNKLMFLDCNTPFLLDIHNNLLCYVSTNVIHSFICSILITKINFDILLIGEDDVSFVVYNQLILNNFEVSLDEIIREIERRHKIIIPVAEDIYQYNRDQKENIGFLMIIMKLNKEVDENILSYVLQFGKRVGVYLILYGQDIDLIIKYKSLFSITLCSCASSKEKSFNLIGISGAETLTDSFDCILKYDELLMRVGIPGTSLDETIRIVKFIELN